MKKIIWIFLLSFSLSLLAIDIQLQDSNSAVFINGDFELANIKHHQATNYKVSSLQLDECINTGKLGEAELPVYSKFISLPETGNFKISNVKYKFEEIDLEDKIVSVGWQDEIPISESYYLQNKWLPQNLVTISDPNIMRSYRFAQVSVAAVQYNPALNKIRIIKDLELELELDRSISKNPLTKKKPSPAFEKIAEENILGTENIRTSESANYLVIAPDNVSDTIQPLLRAKEKLGFKTRLALLSETGSNENQIKDFIQNAYDNWENPPEYVLLIGDVNGSISVPAFFVEGYLHPTCVTDHTYTLLEGTDYFPDVLIGRISVQSEFELNTVIAKIINYEFNPFIDADWMTRALMVSYVQDDYWQFFSPRETVMEVRNKLYDFEYTVVDTFIAPWNSGSSNLRNMINTGYSFVNYRGCGGPEYWAGPNGQMFSINDVIQLNNGSLLPFVTSITCGGGNFAYMGINSVFGETWLTAGTPSFPKGAIGFIGPSEHDTKTWFNNANDMGIYQGVTHEGLYRGGEMLLRGKMELYNNYPFSHAWGNSLNSDQFYFYVYNLLGDPGLSVMTRMPQNIEFEHPAEINTFDNFIPVTITSPMLGSSDFTIAITNADSLVAKGFSDETGSVNIPLESLPEGTYETTASKYGFIPEVSSFNIVQQDIVTVTNIICNDPNAGELVDFTFSIENPTANQEDVSLEFSSENDFVEVYNPGYNFQISAGGTENVNAQFSLDSSWLDTEPFNIIIELTSSSGSQEFLLQNSEKSPMTAFSEMNVANLEECLMQNQTNDFYIELLNCGSMQAEVFQVELFSLNNNATIISGSSSYPQISMNGTAWNQDVFQVEVADVMSGEMAKFQMNIILENETVQELIISVPIGIINEESPTFCDYSYYALESQDSGNFTAPVYDWIEIDPGNGGSGTVINPVHTTYDGEIAIVDLPFTFRYFGDYFDKVSICSNGYVSMGESETIFHRNRMIPSGVGSQAMIAPFWDDLTYGDVYYQYIEDDNIFVVEWSEMRNVYNFGFETFQLILYDPLHYPTTSGDGDIKFQYKDIQNVDQQDHYATVGIENYDQTEGIQMTFANMYAPTSHTLDDETAIFFSTSNAPLVGNDDELISAESLELNNYPNPFNPSTTISFDISIEQNEQIELSIYNLKGQKVKSFTNLQINQSPNHQIVWNGTDQHNKTVSSGIYFYNLSVNGKIIDSKKCLLLK
ncbi:MAG: T9SS type A sorting domain-containing protein [Candidatus Cloacimonetes bacterium]|nr:T9SS type A sorting domain-containing protein [Candidatus Cloacimonadota bacterium]MCF7812927.1 T9SS type A sorting domain-containing protein [Candidatus Cloacimonadota bacterium]MCF7867139.1 T9SS type A sorting domain-containing protein [Candidatus Cloacimonadota bacterium]MCF7882541.1 T9SS type A sorting domain-containing protein [Candidatus Cloacimonadota bacterium]